jgi:hypothetical protein
LCNNINIMKITKNVITILGFTILIIFIFTKIFNFYGIPLQYYGVYLVFFTFLIICLFLFETSYESKI